MTNEEIYKDWMIEDFFCTGRLKEFSDALDKARQDERKKSINDFAEWLDGEGSPIPDRKLQEYIKYHI